MNNLQLKAILFDLDGVLVDSEPLHFEAHKKALESYVINLALEDYMDFGVAKGDDNLYEKASEKYQIRFDKNEISKSKRKIYKDILDKKGSLIEGVSYVLENLYKRYDLAIVSSGSYEAVKYVLGKFKIEKYFKVIVTGDDVERVKPFPDVYLKALEKFGYKKEEYIAVEDSETGISSAKAAGIRCIAIPNDFTRQQDLSNADLIVSSIAEFVENI